MDISQLDQAVYFYLVNCVSPSTQALYASAQRRFMSFCQSKKVNQPFPVSERTLGKFVALMGQQNLKYRTIKCYLSGIRFTQIQLGLGDPFKDKAMPLRDYLLQGVKHVQARAGEPPKPRLPITPDILGHLKHIWLHPPANPDYIMLWAAACTGFFGFLRAGEFTVPSVQDYDPEVHLSIADIAVDNHSVPSVIRIRIKQSKTDPFRQGADIFVGATKVDICPVQALVNYIAIRGTTPGPLFVFRSGDPLTRSTLVTYVQAALKIAGISPEAYTGHSFRIGAATTAAKCGIEDSLIQTLGRWKSTAYLAYIKIPPQQLATVGRLLVIDRKNSEQRGSSSS